MFKGKIVIYKTDPKTGKVYHIEREFDNPEDYDKFISSYKDLLDIFDIYNEPFRILENFEKLGYLLDKIKEDDNVKGILDKYEKKLKEIKRNIEEKENRKKELIEVLNKLNKYKEEFNNLGNYELVKQIEEDILKVENELKNLG